MNLSLLKSAESCRLSGGWIAVLWLGLLILGCISGCGKKGDPVPPRLALPPAVSDLRSEKKEQGIELHWTTAIPDGSFKILRSERFPDEEDCIDCPRNYVVISELSDGDPQLRNDQSSGTYTWIDASVKSENSYFYRIVVCDASGFCSEPSNIVDASRSQK